MAEVSFVKVKINSGNELLQSDNQPLPEPMLGQIYVDTWHHYATMSSRQVCF